jgi:hypothetical protein
MVVGMAVSKVVFMNFDTTGGFGIRALKISPPRTS